MVAVQREAGGSVIALMPVPEDQIHLYGSAGVSPAPAGLAAKAGLDDDELTQVDALVEKPGPGQALSQYALIGRYVLSPAVFDVLDRTSAGTGGEVQLTDAIAELARMPGELGGGVLGVVFRGRRYDTGDKLDYLKAVVRLAREHPQFGSEFSAWLTEFVASGGR
jgi:UTP--glucose-1-phosphate uridylyltransferase